MLDDSRARWHAQDVRTSVYVHFPWCLKKCPYCDFASEAIDRPAVPHSAYADAVVREIETRAESLNGRTLTSVFFGGGTPSLWEPRELGRVLSAAKGAFAEIDADLEVTVECNPTSIDAERAAALRDAGVNRLSIGVQSLDDDRLKWLGRLHGSEMALRALTEVQREIDRVSGDLMFGMPGQSAADVERELERVLDTGVRHVSAYALTIEPGTQFGALHRKGQLKVATEDDYADAFAGAEQYCESQGLLHYEVSNYAAAGEEARHNLHYWRGGDYLGVGAGAVGCLSEARIARRWRNDPRPERYMARPGLEAEHESLGPEDRVREALMLGLRTREGVDLRALEERTGIDAVASRGRAIARRQERGDLVLEAGHLRVPRDRWLLLDGIVADLF